MSENLLTYRNEETKSKDKPIVIYDTLFGNTEKVAQALVGNEIGTTLLAKTITV